MTNYSMTLKRARRLAGAMVGLVCMTPALALGTGLVLNDSTLARLGRLQVNAQMSDRTVAITVQREYWTQWGVVGGDAVEDPIQTVPTARFYRSLETSESGVTLSLKVDGEVIGGSVLVGAEADAVRRDLVLALRDPAPLRQAGQPLFVSEEFEVPNALYGGGVALELGLTQALQPRGTLLGVGIAVDWNRQPVDMITVNVEATTSDAPLRALYSPYHELSTAREDAFHATGAYSGYHQSPSLDLSLLLSTGDEPYRLDLLPFRYDDAEGGTFLALVSPEADPGEENIAPRDIAFVLDRSGSMGGEKIAQARTALKQVLAGLREQDSFAMIAFDEIIETYRDEATLATTEEIEAAQEFVGNVQADGGTNIFDALKSAFQALPINKGQPRYVVMLTDGQPTAGETDTEAILEMARQMNEVGARVVIFGIGDDVNTVLLEKLANQSGGDVIYLRAGMNITAAVESFFAQLTAPMLANPELDMSAFGASALYPEAMGDLFAGQTVAVLGRFATPGEGKIVLRGMRSGELESHEYTVGMPSHTVREGFVPKIWATRHVGTLLHTIKLEGADPALVDEAVSVARRYGIVTEFTYYTVDEEGDSAMTYSAVPMDASGDRAVSTSAALDEYENDSTVRVMANENARWFRDRVFPYRGGWFTDTYLDRDPEIELHFASDAYFALVEAEATLGVGGFLAVGNNVAFELLGRAIRVTDTELPPVEPVPAEASSVPAATLPPAGPTLGVVYAGLTSDGEGQPPQPTLESSSYPGEVAGCTAATQPSSSVPGGLALLGFLILCAALRLRRPAAV